MFRGPFFVAALLAAMLAGNVEAQQSPGRAAASLTVTDEQAILQKARDSYYSLHREGLISFTCGVAPDWAGLLENERRENPETADQAIRLLLQLRFTVTLAADSSFEVTHSELGGQSPDTDKALGRISSGVEEMISGFFDTWKRFVLDAPFPEVNSTYRIDEAGSGYRLFYPGYSTDVLTTLDKNLVIVAVNEESGAFTSTIQPSFRTTSKGYLLSGYRASYKSSDPGETTEVHTEIAYAAVDGLQLVQQLALDGSYGGKPWAVSLTFSDCRAATKPAQSAAVADPAYPARSPAVISAAAARFITAATSLQER